MARIAGVNIPTQKRVEVALTYIYGIGRTQSKRICEKVGIPMERRVNQLTQLAKRMAEQVEQFGRAVSLEPMPANERRIVHLALRDHPAVYTQSSGEGERRKVHIVART